jgi:type VI secretion system secreted protein Hcp
MPIFLKIDGATSTFPGEPNSQYPGRSQWIAARNAFLGQPMAPRDPSHGLAAGKRQHQPIVITKTAGSADPRLFQACATGEKLESVQIDFCEDLTPQHTFKLTNAMVANITSHGAAGKDEIKEISFIFEGLQSGSQPMRPGPVDTHELERIKLTFQKIAMTWTKGGVTAKDDWLSAG